MRISICIVCKSELYSDEDGVCECCAVLAEVLSKYVDRGEISDTRSG